MLGLLAFAAAITHAETTLWMPNVFGDSMVLQRQMNLPVWGKTVPNGEVTIRIQGQTVRTRANTVGDWRVRLKPLRASTAETLIVEGVQNRIEFNDVAVGDVWICSGQSNMEWPLSASANGAAEVQAADHPNIRLFQVRNNADANWQGDVTGSWARCTPQTAAGFSAVGYFFGRSLLRTEEVPIGLIDTTWGGTIAEAWTPREQALTSPIIGPQFKARQDQLEMLRAAYPNWRDLLAQRRNGLYIDSGNRGEQAGWATGDTYDHGFERISLPATFSSVERLRIDGVVWFRRTFTLTEAEAAQAATLNLGAIDDYDITYVNGRQVGATSPGQQNQHLVKRAYQLPTGLLQAGRNTVAVRVYDSGGEGGFSGSPEELSLQVGGRSIPLAGDWGYRIEQGSPEALSALDVSNQPNQPAALFEAMIRPMVPYGIKGAIWYQGESNASRAKEYQSVFQGMIQAWREEWNQGDFPFLFVQLANFMQRHEAPTESQWAELREAQTMTLDLPKTGMAVIIDAGEANDIHPRDKFTVGERLAMSAREMLFPGSSPAGNSPLLASADFRATFVRLNLHNGRSLSTTDGKAPVGFAVRAEGSQSWVWAQARIEGSSIVVEHPEGQPIAEVRYAWADNPAVNVVNGAGLPMSPFRISKR